jgi:post-segregation antitoxin (ccd killing protein)
MYVIRLPNGNLLVPESAISGDGQLVSDAYVEIGPDDADYARLAEQAITEEELAERRRQWQEGDEPLRRQFLDFLARQGGRGGSHDGEDDWPA